MFDNLNLESLYKKLTHPQAASDLTKFFETLPDKVGTTILAIGGVAWAVAGAAIMYGSIQSAEIAQMRSELMSVESMRPPVPQVRNVAVNKTEIQEFVTRANQDYADTGITLSLDNGKIKITGTSGRQYGVFREAVGHIQNGGPGWRVSVEELCVGRECSSQQGGGSFLYGVFAVSRVDIEMPS